MSRPSREHHDVSAATTPDSPSPASGRHPAEAYRRLARSASAPDLSLGLRLAFIRTFAIPSISRVLCQSGQLLRQPRDRADSTSRLVYQLIEFGFDSPQGKSALRRVNQVHSRFQISNDDMRYVLASFAVVPTRWIQRYGRRPLDESEVEATYDFYRELGRHLGIIEIAGSYREMAAWLDDYEAAQAVPNAATTRLLSVNGEQLHHHLGGPLRWRRTAATVMFGRSVRRASGIAEPSCLIRMAVHVYLVAKARQAGVLSRVARATLALRAVDEGCGGRPAGC
jgi:hypothetical protein